VSFSDGPLTGFLAALAGAAGTGMVLGGLVVGLTGTLLSWSRDDLDFQVRRAGYWGGAFGLGALLVEKTVL